MCKARQVTDKFLFLPEIPSFLRRNDTAISSDTTITKVGDDADNLISYYFMHLCNRTSKRTSNRHNPEQSLSEYLIMQKYNNKSPLHLANVQHRYPVGNANLPIGKIFLIAGILLLMVFYWMIPSWLCQEIIASHNSTLHPNTELLLTKRIHWIEVTGISLGAFCFAISIHDFFTKRLNRKVVNSVLD